MRQNASNIIHPVFHQKRTRSRASQTGGGSHGAHRRWRQHDRNHPRGHQKRRGAGLSGGRACSTVPAGCGGNNRGRAENGARFRWREDGIRGARGRTGAEKRGPRSGVTSSDTVGSRYSSSGLFPTKLWVTWEIHMCWQGGDSLAPPPYF